LFPSAVVLTTRQAKRSPKHSIRYWIVAPRDTPILLDFSGVDYISSAGLRVLMMASRRSKAQKGTFAIAAMQPMVQEVFAISRFNLIVPCYASVESASKVIGS
jgi:anti-sigma B factor antagonist/stage II sporulation protein AA (anti-sigma F factor antagonist)